MYVVVFRYLFQNVKKNKNIKCKHCLNRIYSVWKICVVVLMNVKEGVIEGKKIVVKMDRPVVAVAEEAVVEEVKAEAASAEAVETPVEETPEVIETPVVAEEKIEAVK
jgi:hypothetical protein